MEKDTFIDRLADELMAMKPSESTYKGWFRKVAIGTDIPQDSVKAYHEGTHACPGDRLLSLFDHFGPEFEARVRGSSEAPPPDLNKARKFAQLLVDELRIRDDDGVIVTDFTKKAGTK